MENTFRIENIETLKSTCNKIILLLNEHIDGNLMMSQLMCLGDDIKEFITNPIVKNSGILNVKVMLSEFEQQLEKKATLISEAIGDVIAIANMSDEKNAFELIKNQFVVIDRQDLN